MKYFSKKTIAQFITVFFTIQFIFVPNLVQPVNASDQPTLTNDFMFVWGYININSEPAPLGTIVQAKISENNLLVGSVETTHSGAYGSMAVYGDDSYTSEKDGAQRGDNITLWVNRESTNYTFTFGSFGEIEAVDINILEETETPAEEPAESETPAEEPAETETPVDEPIETETPAEEPAESETPAEEPAETETPSSSGTNSSASEPEEDNNEDEDDTIYATNDFMFVWGYININSEPAPLGTIVQAKISENNLLVGSVETTHSGAYGSMAVYGDDSYTSEKDGAQRGDNITLWVNRESTNYTFTFGSFGDVEALDINILEEDDSSIDETTETENMDEVDGYNENDESNEDSNIFSDSSADSVAELPRTTTNSGSITQINQIKNSAKLLKEDNLDAILSEMNQLRNTITEQTNEIKYLRNLTSGIQNITDTTKDTINNFITYGVDDNTKRLGAGERAAVMYSYKNAYNKLPESETELEDAIKIANGRWPSQISEQSEAVAKVQFRLIYKRDANMDNPNDNAAVTVMAYGLRQRAENRNLDSEKNGIKIFKGIYGHVPNTTEEWNIMQAITYSGASR